MKRTKRTNQELEYLAQLEIAGNKVTKWIQNNPKASMWIMIVLAILNLL